MPGLVLISPPAVEPVTLYELKEFLRVDADDSSQDNVIATLAMSARTWVEAMLKRKLVQQTWRILLDFFPGYYAMVTGQPGSSPVLSGPALLAGIRYAIVLPYPPVNAIENFQYENGNGVVTVMNPATDYLQDLQSNPARLTPPFGQMWPVARVALNAVQLDYQVGYAQPVVLGIGGSPPNMNEVQASTYQFQPSDVGRPIMIPGAGPNGGTLNTVIASVDSPPDTNAMIRDSMSTGVQNVTALLVNMQNGNPAFWEAARTAIKLETDALFNGDPKGNKEAAARNMLGPARDLRL
jgi:hypothetical protein